MLSLNYISIDGAADYYDVVTRERLGMEGSPQERYYSEKAGIWMGGGARYLHLHNQSVTREDFVNLLTGNSPKGQKQLVQTGENQLHRAGIDWTFSAPKSVSLAAELIAPEFRDQIYEAQNRAVRLALKYFERNYAEARQTTDYVTETVKTGNLAVAAFFERTSRALDPQLHTHCVIANLTRRPDGKWRALTNEQLHYQKKFIGQVYRNYLACELRQLGLEVESRPKGLFELKGVPQELIEAFSTRSQQIKEMLPALREQYPTLSETVLKAIAAQNSRSPKLKVSEAELQAHWQKKLADAGLDMEKLRKGLFNQPRTELQPVNHVDMALKVLTQEESVVASEDILNTALQYSIGHKTITDVERELKSAKTPVKMEDGLYSTREMVTLEAELAKYLQNTSGSQTPLLARQPFMLLPEDKVLTADQEQALLGTLSSRNKVTAIQGDAGTGKSQLAEVIARNYNRKGYDILPLSPTALAAKGLRDKGLTTANTIDRFLTRRPTHSRRSRLFILEESSQLGSAKLQQILERTHTNDRVLLVGDRHQHQSIDAGAIFNKSQEHSLIDTGHLKKNIRQESGPLYLRQVIGLLANQQVQEAFELLDRHQHIREIADGDERLAALVEAYAAAEAGREPLLITGTNSERRLLNEMIRERLVEQGRVSADGKELTTHQPKHVRLGEKNLSHSYQEGDFFFLNQAIDKLGRGSRGVVTAVDHAQNSIEVSIQGKRWPGKVTIDLSQNGHHLSAYSRNEFTFAEGDKIIFLKNDDALGVQNGLTGTITSLRDDGAMTVRTPDGQVLTIDTSRYGFFDYGYSATSYKVQGSEHARVVYHADTRHFNRFQNFYVAASRAREDIEILTDSKARLLEQVQVQEMKTSTLDYPAEQMQAQQSLGMGLDLSLSEESA